MTHSVLRRAAALIRLGRVHFLIGGFVLHGLGVIIAIYAGASLNLTALLWGQIAITATQLMVHYANDYFDLEADQANLSPTNWSGGSRVLVDQHIQARAALVIALSLAIIGAGSNLILSVWVRPGPVTFVLIALAQGLAWAYSAPPFRLHSRGVGELTTMLIVPLLTPIIGYWLQAGRIDALPLLAVIPLCCFQFAMLLAIEFPDADGDRAVGKRTLVVRMGAARAAILYVGLIVVAYMALPLLVVAGLPLLVGWSAAGLLPLGVWQLWRIRRGDWHNPHRWNGLGFYTIVLLVATAAAELAAFILLIGM